MFIPSKNSFSAAELIVLADVGVHQRPIRQVSGPVAGLLHGSLVETQAGWVPVETLVDGMRVGTWDGGFATLRQVLRHQVHLDHGYGLIHVPGGALGNCTALTLLPTQDVLLESTVAEAVLGQSTVLVSASALAGFRGIARVQSGPTVDLVSLIFAQEEVVFVNSGTLLHCGPAGIAGSDGFFLRLNSRQSRALCDLIAAGATDSGDLPLAA